MSLELLFQTALGVSILLCGLVSGIVLIFAIVVMPGIGRLDDQGFLKGFQVIDGVIQDNQPIFGLVWGGSVIVLLAVTVFAFWQLTGTALFLLICATAIFIAAQLVTATVHLPANNRVASLNIEDLTIDQLKAERGRFESRWNFWNRIRTLMAIITTSLLIVLLMFL